MNCLLLPEDYNYDPSNRDDLTGLAQANILHYHSPKTLLALPLAEAALQHTIETAPPAERDALGTFLAQYFRPAQPPGKWVRPLWGLVRS
jgi:hypothetical protein